MDPVRNIVQMVLDRKMPGLQAVHLGVREVIEIRLPSRLAEEDVVLTPEDDRLRPPRAQELLPGGVVRDVSAIVVEVI